MVKLRDFGGFGLRAAMLAGLVLPSAAWAQAAKPRKAAAPVEIEEITVTAQKREENLQEVPISVTALSGAALEQSGTTSVSDLGESVPNLYITAPGYGTSNTVAAMRGTSQVATQLSVNTTVGLYVDGVYIAKNVGNNLDLEDLDHVEVLRGPQGTLFGRNTTGGAINMVTKKPTEERSITAATEVGNFSSVHSRLTLNVPVFGKNGFFQSDALGTLSIRQNVVYKSHDGYYRNQSPTSLPASGGSELDTVNRILSMTAVRWQPIQPLTVDYSFEYNRWRQTPPYMAVTAIFPDINPAIGPGGPFDLTPYVRKNRVDAVGLNAPLDSNLKPNRLTDDGNHRMHILTAAWDLGELGPLGKTTLRSISAYRAWSKDSTSDLDSSPMPILNGVNHNNLDTWSEELQWVGSAPRLQ